MWSRRLRRRIITIIITIITKYFLLINIPFSDNIDKTYMSKRIFYVLH